MYGRMTGRCIRRGTYYLQGAGGKRIGCEEEEFEVSLTRTDRKAIMVPNHFWVGLDCGCGDPETIGPTVPGRL